MRLQIAGRNADADEVAGALDPVDPELSEGVALAEVDQAELAQLEQGQETDDDLETAGEVLGELGEGDVAAPGQLEGQLLDRL